MPRVIVIGAGIGSLTAAAMLARAGLDVTVHEAQVYPGGCASTYFHQGYRFDAGATLAAGFYPGGPMDKVTQAAGIDSWPAHPVAAAMVVHLPDGTQTTRYSGEAHWDEYRFAFGDNALSFFRWQERTADAMWDGFLPAPLRRLPPLRTGGWGAFVLYAGLDGTIIPSNFPLHHQIIVRRPLGEGNSVICFAQSKLGRQPRSGGSASAYSQHANRLGWLVGAL